MGVVNQGQNNFYTDNVGSVVSFAGTLRQIMDELCKAGLEREADYFKPLYRDALRKNFVVSVIGSFSNGKSTLINALIGRKIMPVSCLQTTALITKICYSSRNKEKIIHLDSKGDIIKEKKISDSAWDGLLVNNLGETQPSGWVITYACVPWLQQNCIELFDTPGFDDLSSKNAKLLNNTILRSDAVIICIDATRALGLNEKLIIQQRIATRKIPFLMLVITKLDAVAPEERKSVVLRVKAKLAAWQVSDELLVYISEKVDIPNSNFIDIIGIDKIKATICSWVQNCNRFRFMCLYLNNRALEIVSHIRKSLCAQLSLVEESEDKAKQTIERRKLALSNDTIWKELFNGLKERELKCFELFSSILSNKTKEIVERLRQEVNGIENPKKWCEEVYQYRVRCELINLNSELSKSISSLIYKDLTWLNKELASRFNKIEDLAHDGEFDRFSLIDTNSLKKPTLNFQDIDKKTTNMQILTVAFGVIGIVAASLTGIASLTPISTIGVTTGSSLLIKTISGTMGKKQRQILISHIHERVPDYIRLAASDGRKCIKKIYIGISDELRTRQDLWLDSQNKIIDNGFWTTDKKKQKSKIEHQLSCIDRIYSYFCKKV